MATTVGNTHVVSNTPNVVSQQRLRGSAFNQKTPEQKISLPWAPSSANPDCQSSADGEPSFSWADIPDIPRAWELLESPQVWMNGDCQLTPKHAGLENVLCDTTPIYEFESKFSSTSSPLLEDHDTFNTPGTATINFEPLIHSIESNEQQTFLASPNFPPENSPLPATSHPEIRTGSSKSGYSKEPCSTRARNHTMPLQRHKIAGSDTHSSQESDEERLAERRRKNKLAARKLRQKKLDQVSELEAQLEEVRKERDALRLRAAKSEGELLALRQMIDQKVSLS
ncbi:uncharacterized protein N7469_005335 [Penicillium citrinum]|uniref:BZIP domain-containing protein n=1 Tax=Penicillium citrinum TaxID=5077 RepID=A0A9W9P127_PENCI|nr:uncharacterized protein N7469_005335 [Penicillium citrinum]KAJ5233569.1 hypothetical protein N7469_005335 [Penicillium citrinum]